MAEHSSETAVLGPYVPFGLDSFGAFAFVVIHVMGSPYIEGLAMPHWVEKRMEDIHIFVAIVALKPCWLDSDDQQSVAIVHSRI